MKTRNLLYVLILLALACIVYIKAFSAGFVGDDLAMIPNNHRNFSGVANIVDYFRTGVWEHSSLGLKGNSIYRPLWLVWMFAIYQFAGESPLVWHISNLLLHTLNSFLLFHLIKELYPSAKEKTVLLAATLFLLYPASCQNVIWISGSTDLFLSVFSLSGLLAYVHFRNQGNGKWFYVSIFFTACAILVKETGLILLPIYFLIDSRSQLRTKNIYITYIVSALLLCVYFLLRFKALGHTAGMESSWAFNTTTFTRAFEYATVYIRTIFFPWPLPFTTRHLANAITTFADPVLGILIITLLAYLFIRRPNTRIAIGLIIFPLSIPVLLAFNAKGLFATRFLYLPVIGLVLLIFPLIEVSVKKKPVNVVLASYLLLMASFTVAETAHWKNQGVFIDKILGYDNQNTDLWIEQAQFYAGKNLREKALTIFHRGEAAIVSETGKAEVIASRAKFFADIGENDQSIVEFKKIISVPEQTHIAWTGIGNNLWTTGHLDEALTAYAKAIEAKPGYFYALYNYGMLNAQLQRFAAAIEAYEAIDRLPDSAVSPTDRKKVEQSLQVWRIAMRFEQ